MLLSFLFLLLGVGSYSLWFDLECHYGLVALSSDDWFVVYYECPRPAGLGYLTGLVKGVIFSPSIFIALLFLSDNGFSLA